MRLTLQRPIVFFDIETTGLNIMKDRIIELSYIKVFPDGQEQKECLRINPGMPIPPESTAVHHITDDDVRQCPSFEQLAHRLAEVFTGCDVAGFNSNHFDVPVLDEEFTRAGIQFNWNDCKFIDIQTIFHKKEKRDLAAAYLFYCGAEMQNHHSSMADVETTYDVFKAQLERYDDIGSTVPKLSEYSSFSANADLAGRIIYNAQGQEVINFGKHKGKLLEDVLRVEPSYASWMLSGDFASSTKRIVSMVQQRVRDKEAQERKLRDQQPPTAQQLEQLKINFGK